MEIRNLKEASFDTVFCAFEQAFSDYEIKFEKTEVSSMLKRRGFNPELSFAAFNGNDIVAFTLNGIGNYHNIYTAYDTGTGTLKEFRGKGIAREIFKHSIPYLKKAGVQQYLLEVLQNNTRAISIYQKLGFEITQEFDCFRQKREKIRDVPGIKQASQIEITSVKIGDISLASDFCDFHPSWQNSTDSIKRAGSDLVCLGAFISGELVGYCVFDPLTGDLSQLAVNRKYRRKEIASCLFREVIGQTSSDVIKALNIDPACHSLSAFLKNKNIEMTGKQFEMILSL